MAKKKDSKKTEDVKDTKKKSAPKKATPKKTTKAKPEKVEVKEETKAEVEEKEEKPKQRSRAVDIDLHELIEVRSVTHGGLVYISPKTNMKVLWEQLGDVEYMEFAELVTMKSAKPNFLNKPLLVVDDEDVIQKLGLTKLYEDMYNVDNIDEFFDLSVTDMSEQLKTMPEGIKTLVGDKASAKIKDETLYDLRKIKLIEEKANVDLQILMD